MTTLGVNSSDRDRTTGWADINPVIHVQNRLLSLAVSAWKLASLLADADEPDWEKIAEIQQSARYIENLARSHGECNCFMPEQSCEVCRSLARLIYEEEMNEGQK